MPRSTMTRSVAWAASIDAGTRNARRHGRNRWNLDDAEVAAATFDRLWPPRKDLAHTPPQTVPGTALPRA